MSRHARVESCAACGHPGHAMPRVASTLHLDLTLTEKTHDAWMKARSRHGRRDARASRRSSEGYGAHPLIGTDSKRQMIGDAKGNRFVPPASRSTSATCHVDERQRGHNVVFWPTASCRDADRPARQDGRDNGPAHRSLFAAPNAPHRLVSPGSKPVLQELLLATPRPGYASPSLVLPIAEPASVRIHCPAGRAARCGHAWPAARWPSRHATASGAMDAHGTPASATRADDDLGSHTQGEVWQAVVLVGTGFEPGDETCRWRWRREQGTGERAHCRAHLALQDGLRPGRACCPRPEDRRYAPR